MPVNPAAGDEPARAVLYARVSSKEQEEEGFSIPAQVRLLREYAERNAMEVVREFVDVETAKRTGRAGFGEMLQFLKARGNRCRTVLVEKTDRLYRNAKDWVTLDDIDLEVHLVKEGTVLSKDSRSSEKLMHGIKVVMAKHFIDNLREEVVKGMAEKVTQGHWPHKAPVGYRNVTTSDGRRIIEQDPETAPIVKRLFERFATGNFSLKEATKMAASEGLVFRKSRAPICVSTIQKALRSPLYKGEVTWAGRCYPGAHSPLVSPSLWDRVQSTLSGRVRGGERKNGRGLPFVSLLRCGHCGCSLTPEVHKGGRYVYYRCSFFKGKCPGRWARQEELNEGFAEYLRRLRFDDEVLEEVLACMNEGATERRRIREQAAAVGAAEKKRLQTRLDLLYDDRLDGRIDETTYDRKSAALRTQLQHLHRETEESRAEPLGLLDDVPRLLSLAQKAADLFLQAPFSEKRKLVNLVLLNSNWRDGELHATYREPFATLAVAAKGAGEKQLARAADSAERPGWYP